MRIVRLLGFALIICVFLTGCRTDHSRLASNPPAGHVQTFPVKGVLKEVKPDGVTALIQHEAIPNYMAAMTMPFRAKEPAELAGLQAGDEISFRLLVTDNESWIDRVSRTGRKEPVSGKTNSTASGRGQRPSPQRHPLLDFSFTNELGQPVSLSQFKGQALAITFFFTRCPIPDFCPRLSKNFEEASVKLALRPAGPTNWHFLSVSFDTEFDTPAVLRAYGARYHYDPRHWSFLTGPKEKITELAELSDVAIEPDGAFFNHSFRTMIIDAGGHLQMSFPIGGNLSDAIVTEIVKAAAMK